MSHKNKNTFTVTVKYSCIFENVFTYLYENVGQADQSKTVSLNEPFRFRTTRNDTKAIRPNTTDCHNNCFQAYFGFAVLSTQMKNLCINFDMNYTICILYNSSSVLALTTWTG